VIRIAEQLLQLVQTTVRKYWRFFKCIHGLVCDDLFQCYVPHVIGGSLRTLANTETLMASEPIDSRRAQLSGATTLVTRRVYSRIRHPIYMFGAMIILGLIWIGRLLYDEEPKRMP